MVASLPYWEEIVWLHFRLSMIRLSYKFTFLTGMLLIFVLAGCSGSESQLEDEYFIRVRDRVVTVIDFNRAFEITKSAYPHKAMQDPDAIREAQLLLLNQMTEELILLERAEELGIEISETEFEKAILDIKKDFPNDEFEKMLLEYAVPYDSWKKGLKIRMLMEKVVAKELEDQIIITPDDITKYYQEHFKDNSISSDQKEVTKDVNVMIMKHLRREKVEEVYKSWIKKIKKKYTVEINKAQWEKIIGS